jgi:hypothetical protein
MKRHKIIHNPEKLFKCNIMDCTYTTLEKKDMNIHKIIHNPEKLFKCNIMDCTYTTSYNGNMKIHQKTHYIIETDISPL